MVLGERAQAQTVSHSGAGGLSRWGYCWRWGAGGWAIALALASHGYGQGWQLPHWHCLFQATLGIPGPGCGLTRSWIALAQGDVLKSLQFHLLGPVLALGALMLVCQAAVELGLGLPLAAAPGPWARLDLLGLCSRRARLLGWGFAGVTLIYYGLRLYGRYSAVYGAGLLPSALESSGFWQFIQVGAAQL